MRTKKDIQYDLKKLDASLEQSNKMLKVLETSTKMLNDITMAVDRLSDVVINLSNLPEAPPTPTPPPTCSPEELEKFEKLVADVKEALARR